MKILLVDDEKLLLESLEIILTMNDMEVAGKASDGKEALKLLESVSFDIALVDLNMRGMGGIELIKIMKKKYPDVKILVLTTFYDEKYITEAISGGADGYLLKDSGREAILGAITQIMGGISVIDPKVMHQLMRLISSRKSNALSEDTAVKAEEKTVTVKTENAKIAEKINVTADDITNREKEICALMVEGLSNRQIADKLFISEGTVKNYISNIYDKTGIHDRVKLILELKA